VCPILLNKKEVCFNMGGHLIVQETASRNFFFMKDMRPLIALSSSHKWIVSGI
jgi:hypothetical protein